MEKYQTAIQKVGRNEYINIHKWIKKNHGKASKCEHCKLNGKKRYEWALKKGFEYERKIGNYMQLCTSCHKIYDFHPDISARISKTLMGHKYNLGFKPTEITREKLRKFFSKPIIQLTMNGDFIKKWDSAAQARNALKIYGIRYVVNGKQKSAGGYKWKSATE